MDISETIFGPDLSSTDDKSTSTKPKPVCRDNIKILKRMIQQHQNLELAVDVFYVNELKFISGVERSIWNRTDVYLQNRNKDDFYKVVDAITIVYNNGGFTIEII